MELRRKSSFLDSTKYLLKFFLYLGVDNSVNAIMLHINSKVGSRSDSDLKN